MIFLSLIWYMYGIGLVYARYTKMTKKIDDDWTCLIRFYLFWYSWGIQKNWYMTGKRLFSLYQRYFQYQRLREMTIFDWYTTGIWHHGICITTFFFAVTHKISLADLALNEFCSPDSWSSTVIPAFEWSLKCSMFNRAWFLIDWFHPLLPCSLYEFSHGKNNPILSDYCHPLHNLAPPLGFVEGRLLHFHEK